MHSPIIIGIDHGYGNIKTVHCCFKTDVIAYDKEAIFKINLLVYGGKYYLIWEEHKEFISDSREKGASDLSGVQIQRACGEDCRANRKGNGRKDSTGAERKNAASGASFKAKIKETRYGEVTLSISKN